MTFCFREPLPELNELCRSAQDILKDIDRSCYFHGQKYPTYKCARTECGSVVYKFVKDGGVMKPEHISALSLTKIPDQTPCAPGKWCQAGLCVETNDVRVKAYDKIPPINGS